MIEKVKKQDNEEAWTLFSETYKHYIMGVIVKLGIPREETNDIQQEILVKLWKKLPDFDYQPNKGQFRTWLYQVIRNHVYDYFNSRAAKYKSKCSELKPNDDRVSDDVIDTIMKEEWKIYITSLALKRLESVFSAQNIEIFKKLLAGANTKEVAAEYSLQPNSINKVKNRIKERLIVEIAEIRQEIE